MKGPQDFEDALTAEDLAKLDALEREVEAWFGEKTSSGARKHDEYLVNTNGTGVPERVWRELVERASTAGWDASMQGAMVSIKKGPPRVPRTWELSPS